jgi:dihydrodipicolinate synthase/N-acetylneuraminate lyase
MKLTGIFPPLPTPLNADGSLDTAGLARLADHILTGGCAGLFMLGTTGEFASLDIDFKVDLIRRSAQLAAGRGVVLAGITETSAAASVRTASALAGAGAQFAVLTAPFYYKPSQAELLKFCTTVADRCPIPVVLYSMPHYTRTIFETATISQLATHKNIVGIKDSGGSLPQMLDTIAAVRHLEHFSFLTGDERHLVPTLIAGAVGGVSGGALLEPSLYPALIRAVASGDLPKIRSLQDRLARICSEILFLAPSEDAGVLKCIKAALSVMGIIQNHTHDPLLPLDASYVARITTALKSLELIR